MNSDGSESEDQRGRILGVKMELMIERRVLRKGKNPNFRFAAPIAGPCFVQ